MVITTTWLWRTTNFWFFFSHSGLGIKCSMYLYWHWKPRHGISTVGELCTFFFFFFLNLQVTTLVLRPLVKGMYVIARDYCLGGWFQAGVTEDVLGADELRRRSCGFCVWWWAGGAGRVTEALHRKISVTNTQGCRRGAHGCRAVLCLRPRARRVWPQLSVWLGQVCHRCCCHAPALPSRMIARLVRQLLRT